jgi:hypothetical protein
VLGNKGQVIDAVLSRWVLGNNLGYSYSPLPSRVTVFLLAGYLAAMAAGAVFVVNQQTVSSHNLLLNKSDSAYF